MLVTIVAYSLLACTCHAIQSVYPSYGSSGKAFGSERGSTIDGSNGCLHTFRENSAGLSSHNAIYKVRRASAAEMHVVIFTLKERNMDVLKSVLHQVSDPRSKRYGDYMTKQEVNDLTTNPDSYSEIMEYLHASGAETIHDGSTRDVITARAPVGTWERMLDTVFNVYLVEDKEQSVKNRDAKMQTFIRSEKYSVPSSLHEHIGSVLNTVQLPPSMAKAHLSIKKPKKNETWPSTIFSGGESNTLMTPKRLNEVYNIDDNTGHPKATQAICGGTDSYFSAEDVTSFQGQFDLPLQSLNQSFGNHSFSSAWCISNSIYPCVYGNLQIQYMTAMCTSPTIFYNSDYLTHSSWLRDIYISPNTPLVATIVDTYYEDQLSFNEVEDFENWAVKLGVIGVTVVVASGDDGASLSPETDIILGTDVSRSSQCSYASAFPASCPYVLTVGATQVLCVNSSCMSPLNSF